MSEPVFAGLPRFDIVSATPPGNWRRPLDEAPLARPAAPSIAPPREDIPSQAIAAEAPPVRPADLVQVEAALKSIAARLDRIERDAQAQAMQAVQTMTAKLFPELSRRFLAEEIGRSLPRLVPQSAAVIEIRAGEALAAELQTRIAAMPGLANRCTVLSSGSESAGQADISWQSGGVSFDFDALLATLQAQLNPSQPMTKE
ncbi:hypothetical protein [Hyphomonas sp.]|uniref:hypothetical protein n=1 Tax=Hyphomonas sp. TaxID=87 RepID=UPI00391BF5CA